MAVLRMRLRPDLEGGWGGGDGHGAITMSWMSSGSGAGAPAMLTLRGPALG